MILQKYLLTSKVFQEKQMQLPMTSSLSPPTLRSLAMKVVLWCQILYVKHSSACKVIKNKFYEFQNSIRIPKTLSDDILSFSNMFGTFTALNGIQTIWREESGASEIIHYFEFDWEGSYTETLNFETYPFAPYFYPEKYRFYMDICHKFNDDSFGEAIIYSMDPSSYYSCSNLTFKNSHNPFCMTQNFPEGNKWTKLSWKLPDLMPDKTLPPHEFLKKALTFKMGYAERYYFDGDFLIFEQQKNHQISENIDFICNTKYKMEKLPYFPLWPLQHPIFSVWPPHVCIQYIYKTLQI